MKVLIWIGCFFVATILNTLLGYATGLKAGYLVFYFAVYFVAKKLGNKWDEYKAAKAEQKKVTQQQNIVIEEKAAVEDVNQVRFCRKCGEKLLNNSQFCRRCGTEIILNEEISKNKNMLDQTKTAPKVAVIHKWRCDRCGNMRTQTPCEYCKKE